MKAAWLCLGLAASFAVASPAAACRGVFSETYVFLPALPADIAPDAIVLKVKPQRSVTAFNSGLQVEVIEVVRGDWPRDTAWIDYGFFTSCSRVHLPEEGALVVGVPREYSPTTLVARQYYRRDWEGTDDGN